MRAAIQLVADKESKTRIRPGMLPLNGGGALLGNPETLRAESGRLRCSLMACFYCPIVSLT